ncbi:MAG: hypothetical protein QXM68_00050 [Candidatus Aenigmatarchaeota archaeon]|nr:archaeosortase/exosortase family protein [Candidatus Aenigmarchaeota archaeon]
MGKRVQKKKDLKQILIFLLKVNLLLIPFYAIIYFDLSYYPAQKLFALIIFDIIKFFGFYIKIDETMLLLGDQNYPVNISFDCIGWKSSYSLIALVIASSGIMKEKLIFLAKWLPAMVAINILRVIIAILTGFLLGFESIKIIHDYILQPAMILVVLTVWWLYAKDKIYSIKK